MNDFLGTFNLSQFQRLVDFAKKQAGDVKPRIQHLAAEQVRVGIIAAKYDKGAVVAYSGDPPNSLIGKLLSVYETLGGDPIFDLQVRQKDTQPLYLLRGDETSSAKQMSDGRIVGGDGLGDAPSAILVQQMTAWMSEAVQYKRESLERKIRRALDYSDQLGDEIRLLGLIQQGKEINGSLDNIIEQIQLLIKDRNYRAIADDGGKDPNGLMTHAPFLGLEPGPDRTATDYGRTLEGYVTPESE